MQCIPSFQCPTPPQAHPTSNSSPFHSVFSSLYWVASITLRWTPRKRLRLETRFWVWFHSTASPRCTTVYSLWNPVCTLYLKHIIIQTYHTSSSQWWHFAVGYWLASQCNFTGWIQALPLPYCVMLNWLFNLSRSHKAVLCIKWYITCKSFSMVWSIESSQ